MAVGDFVQEIAPFRRGALGKTGPHVIVGRVADADTKAGRVVAPGASDNSVKLPASAADVEAAAGVVVYHPNSEVAGAAGEENATNDHLDLVEQGEIVVEVEEAVAYDADVFVRHSGAELGICRSDQDGTTTLTVDTAVNDKEYFVTLDGAIFATTADGTATVTEIATALAAEIDADAAYGATSSVGVITVTPVSGTTIVGSKSSEISTTTNGTAAKMPAAKYRSSTSGAGVALVRLNRPA